MRRYMISSRVMIFVNGVFSLLTFGYDFLEGMFLWGV